MRRSLASWNFVSVLCKMGSTRRWSRRSEIACIGRTGRGDRFDRPEIYRAHRPCRERGIAQKAFVEFLKGLQKNLNPSIDEGQAVEMLAQHMITRPVFDALFKDYQFVKNNAVSRSMQRMLELLESEAMEKDTEVLNKFYENSAHERGRY